MSAMKCLVVFLIAINYGLCEQKFLGKTSMKKYYANDEALDFMSAEKACNHMNGSLATIRSKEEDELMAGLKLAGEDYWIGAKNRPMTDIYQWFVDRTPVTFTHWVSRPGGKLALCNGVSIDSESKSWGNTACNYKTGSICEVGVANWMDRGDEEVMMMTTMTTPVTMMPMTTMAEEPMMDMKESNDTCMVMMNKTDDLEMSLARMSERLERSIEMSAKVQAKLESMDEELSKTLAEMSIKLASMPRAKAVDRAKDFFSGGL